MMHPFHETLLGRRALFLYFMVIALLGVSCAGSRTKKLTKIEQAAFKVEIAAGALREGDPIGALQQLIAAEELAPELPELHHTKALAFHAKGNHASALSEARIAVRLSPKYSDANNTLGKLLVDAGKYPEAEPYLQKAAQDPLNREAYKALTNLGILYYRKEDESKARDAFDRAIESSRAQACIAYYYKGHLDLKEAKLEKTKSPEKLKSAIMNYYAASNQLCSNFAQAHLALAMTYEQSGQYDLARRKYIEIQQLFSSTEFADRAINHLRNLP